MVKGILESDADGNTINVRGFTEPLKKGDDVGISINIKNPSYSQETGTFDMYVMRTGTTDVLARKLQVPGVPIIAGLISEVQLMPMFKDDVIISKNKDIWFV